MVSALYPRTITVKRSVNPGSQNNSAQVGGIGYFGMDDNPNAADATSQGTTVVVSGLSASIQAKAQGRKKDSTLPSDAVFAPTWAIFIDPASGVADGVIRDRDLIFDDIGYRYEVGQSYAAPLGTGVAYQLLCIRLEA